jgi:RimJ/RimL family protein N-acetyltransferase
VSIDELPEETARQQTARQQTAPRMPAPRIETARIVLRRMIAEDALAFSQYRSDPEVARYQSWDAPYPLRRAQRFIAAMRGIKPGTPGEWMQLAITLRGGAEDGGAGNGGADNGGALDGSIIGDVAFCVLPDHPRQAEIGFTLAAAHQGKGYGSEAVRGLLSYLFEAFYLHRVRANCDPRNTASGRLLERVGMRHEGRFVDSLWLKGGWVSEDWYAILHREWIEIRQEQNRTGQGQIQIKP